MAERLQRYRKMRDFSITPEPRGEARARARKRLRYYIQRHAATRLHYDFRLELEGVLKSWAVPKGPSLDPANKRLAVQTEDHPLEYGEFEGVIPEKQYGAGEGLLADRGLWIPEDDDPLQALRKGRLHFRLDGKKLHGRWILTRTRGAEDKPQWLLIKRNDEDAAPGLDITRERPESVKRAPKKTVTPPKKVRKKERGPNGPNMVLGVKISHPERVIWPELGVRKIELARYIEEVGDWLLPHVKNRPLSLVRCPDGVAGECFYQRHLATAASRGSLQTVKRERSSKRAYIYAASLDAVVSAVQNGAVELHTWGATMPDIKHPDRITMDLDPDETLPWTLLAEGTLLTKRLLDGLGLKSFLKTTGGKGLHVVAPIKPQLEWDAVKAFTGAIARMLVKARPELFTVEIAKARRANKIFADYLRNSETASAIAAYSPRARANGGVSVPLSWDEL